jgi:hypothetical protein
MHSDERQDASSQHPNATLYNAVTSLIQVTNDRHSRLYKHTLLLSVLPYMGTFQINVAGTLSVQLFTLYVVCQLRQNSCSLGEDELRLEQAAALPECLQSSIRRALSCNCTKVQHTCYGALTLLHVSAWLRLHQGEHVKNKSEITLPYIKKTGAGIARPV